VEIEPVVVFVEVDVLVDDGEPVIVRVANIDCVGLGDADDVLLDVAVFVDVRVCAIEMLRIAVGVAIGVGRDVFERVVVRVDVLLDVPVVVGTTCKTSKLRCVVIFSTKLRHPISIRLSFRFPSIETRLANKIANEKNRILNRIGLNMYIDTAN
jgi:hypothetical protein